MKAALCFETQQRGEDVEECTMGTTLYLPQELFSRTCMWVNPIRFGSTFGVGVCEQAGSSGPVWFVDSAWFGTVVDPVRSDSVRFNSIRFGAVRLSAVPCVRSASGSVRHIILVHSIFIRCRATLDLFQCHTVREEIKDVLAKVRVPWQCNPQQSCPEFGPKISKMHPTI